MCRHIDSQQLVHDILYLGKLTDQHLHSQHPNGHARSIADTHAETVWLVTCAHMIEQEPDFVDGAKLLRPLCSLPAHASCCETWHKIEVESLLPWLLLDLHAAGKSQT